ncbi:MAG: YcaO-like family protein [Candidatus Nitrosocosmicus sp.]|nr:YcaO-like family protein [Candidatus Nitrosocosmicus sp.]MDN5868801.1 YcaO-like family protein [Candidatus Nitrosocosmicus sp.]
MNNLFRGVSSKVGIVRNVFQVLREIDDPRLFYTMAFVSNADKNFESSDAGSSGAGFTLSDSINRTLGEAYERYALDFYNPETIVFGNYKKVQNQYNVHHPKDVYFFSDEQYSSNKFRFSKFDEDTNIGWTEGVSLLTGQKCLFPAQMIYFGYKRKDNEPEICYSTSNGCAAGKSYIESIIKGLYEVVERDAVMLTWYKKISHDIINVKSSKFLNNLMEKYFCYNTMEYRLLNADVGLNIPVIIGIAIDHVSHICKFNMGAAANLNPCLAAEKALLETGQGRPYVKYLNANTDGNFHTITIKNIKNFLDALRFYANPDNFHFVKFLIQSNFAIDIGDIFDQSKNDIHQNIKIIINNLSKYKCHPYVFDLTTDDLKEIGIFVTRVVIPELVPFCSPMYPYLGHPRLNITLRNSNHPKGLNFLPHPFP